METRSDRLGVAELLAEADWARALARKLVRDTAAADDVVQEAWLAALRHPPAATQPVRPWLATVLRNAARQVRRGERRRQRREREVAAPEPLPSAAEMVEKAEAQRALVDAVLELPEPYRRTLLLRYFENVPAAEIARRQQVPSPTVRWRLQEGRAQLRSKLDARFGGDRRAWALMLLPLVRPPQVVPAVSGFSSFPVLRGGRFMPDPTKLAALAAAIVLPLLALAYFGSRSSRAAEDHVVAATPATLAAAPVAAKLASMDAAPPRLQPRAGPGHDGTRSARVRVDMKTNLKVSVRGGAAYGGAARGGATVETGHRVAGARVRSRGPDLDVGGRIATESSDGGASRLGGRGGAQRSLDVRQAAHTAIDATAKQAASCKVRGRLRIEGVAVAGWTVRLIPDRTDRVAADAGIDIDIRNEVDVDILLGELDWNGGFEIEVSQRGRYRLEIADSSGPRGLRLYDSIEIEASLSWQLDLSMGGLEIDVGPGFAGSPLGYHWQGRGDLDVVIPLEPGAGTRKLPAVPSGRGRVIELDDEKSSLDPRSAPVIRNVDVPARGDARVELH